MIIAIAMMLLCIMLGGFMIRSCMGKTNSSSEVKQSISDVRKIIDKKALIKYKRSNRI
ncbi:hypothetical protein ACFMMX_003802 [Salmonella enterica]